MMLELSTLIVRSPMLYLVRDKHSVNNTVETFCAYCAREIILKATRRPESKDVTLRREWG